MKKWLLWLAVALPFIGAVMAVVLRLDLQGGWNTIATMVICIPILIILRKKIVGK